MFKAFINSFKVKELRDRILFTAGIIILCRIAANIPCPGVDTYNLSLYFDKAVQDLEQLCTLGHKQRQALTDDVAGHKVA